MSLGADDAEETIASGHSDSGQSETCDFYSCAQLAAQRVAP